MASKKSIELTARATEQQRTNPRSIFFEPYTPEEQAKRPTPLEEAIKSLDTVDNTLAPLINRDIELTAAIESNLAEYGLALPDRQLELRQEQDDLYKKRLTIRSTLDFHANSKEIAER